MKHGGKDRVDMRLLRSFHSLAMTVMGLDSMHVTNRVT
jgi:hypothetical protein